MLLLNLLIAQISSICEQDNHVGAAKYQLDKAKLMIGQEDLFPRFESASIQITGHSRVINYRGRGPSIITTNTRYDDLKLLYADEHNLGLEHAQPM